MYEAVEIPRLSTLGTPNVSHMFTFWPGARHLLGMYSMRAPLNNLPVRPGSPGLDVGRLDGCGGDVGI